MTFFELIRSSLLADSAEKRPPATLFHAVCQLMRSGAKPTPALPEASQNMASELEREARN